MLILLIILYPDHARALAQTEIPGGFAAWLIGTPTTVLAFVTWAWFTGKIHSDKELQRVIARCDADHERIVAKLDATEAELRERNREARETLVPTLTKATLLLTRFVDRQSDTPPPKGRG